MILQVYLNLDQKKKIFIQMYYAKIKYLQAYGFKLETLKISLEGFHCNGTIRNYLIQVN